MNNLHTKTIAGVKRHVAANEQSAVVIAQVIEFVLKIFADKADPHAAVQEKLLNNIYKIDLSEYFYIDKRGTHRPITWEYLEYATQGCPIPNELLLKLLENTFTDFLDPFETGKIIIANDKMLTNSISPLLKFLTPKIVGWAFGFITNIYAPAVTGHLFKRTGTRYWLKMDHNPNITRLPDGRYDTEIYDKLSQGYLHSYSHGAGVPSDDIKTRVVHANPYAQKTHSQRFGDEYSIVYEVEIPRMPLWRRTLNVITHFLTLELNKFALEEMNKHYVTISRLLIEKAEANARLEELVITDSLTGILNRRGGEKFIDVAWPILERSTGDKLCVLMIDIDKFKDFNEKYGHIIGDKTLQVVAKEIKNTIREGDCVYRYGGEEFCVILTNTRLPDAAKAAEKIRRAVEKCAIPISDNHTVPCTISLGLTDVTPSKKTETFTQAMIRADEALRQAKREGRNRTIIIEDTLP